MKHIIITALVATIYLPTTMAQINDSLSYSLGIVLSKSIEQQGFTDVNLDEMLQGMRDAKSGNAKVSPVEAQQRMQQYMQEKAAASHADVKNAGEAYLADNAKRDGVTTLPSGLQYEVMTQGDGATPAATDKVTTHYHGMLIDGTVFDSSVERGEPATFPVNGVIQGWQEILQLMPVGSKYKVFIPYNLAYGERGAGASIPPYAALVFEIELLDIN